MAKIEIKSSLVNHRLFKHVKNSLINASLKDGKDKFRVKMLEYINDSCDSNNDMFFYDMLEFVRFLNPTDNAVAYTDPNKLIYLNAPDGGGVGESARIWEFIYCHECLHQLWDTFEVAEKIKSKGITYNHTLLNIASDCVINDYLKNVRKKMPFEKGIFPETIKEEFGITYDRRTDTQFSLYMKLLPKAEEAEKFAKENPELIHGKIKPKSVEKEDGPTPPPPPPPPPVKHSKDYIKGWTQAIKDVVNGKVVPVDDKDNITFKPIDTGNKEYDKGYNDSMDQIIDGLINGLKLPPDGGQNPPGKPGDLPQIPWDIDDKDKSKGGDDSNDSDGSDDSDNSDDKDKSKGGDDSNDNELDADEAAKEAQEAAKEAQEAANKAKEIADAAKSNKDKDADNKQEIAKEAQDAADKAKEAAKEAQEAADKNDKEKANEAKQRAKSNSNRAKAKCNELDEQEEFNANDISEEELEKIKQRLADVIEKYRDKIAGDFGSFINKCKSSQALKKDGLKVNVRNASAGKWNKQLNETLNTFLKQKIRNKQRNYTETYSRIKRGSGFVKFGEPVRPGRKQLNEKMIVDVAFYLDCSGSMGGDHPNSKMTNVHKATYAICESLKTMFGKSDVVDKLDFKLFLWDTRFYEIEYGKSLIRYGGNTMPFHELLEGIEQRTPDYLINIIITDGEFYDFNTKKVEEILKHRKDSLTVYITNESYNEKELKTLQFNNKPHFIYIQAERDFGIDKI